jgi:putative flippase GtrA
MDMSVPSNKPASKRPVVFLGVGVGNTLLDFLFYTLLTSTVFKNGKHIALAGIISGTFALFCAFLTHSFITWRGSHISRRTVLKFVAFTGFGMWVIRPTLLTLFIHLTGLYNWAYKLTDKIGLPFTRDFITNTGAFGFMVVVVLIYNYYVYSHFVFKSTADVHTEQESH